MKQLSQLVLNSPRIISLRPLEQLSELWWLDLSGTATGSADLATIARSKKLFYLNLSFTQIEDVGLAHLAGLSELNSLSLLDTRITDAGLDLLTGLTKCRYLHVDATGVTDGGVASLAAKFPAMNVTHSRPFDRKESLAQLRESGQPKELNLSNLLLRDDDLIDLKRLK